MADPGSLNYGYLQYKWWIDKYGRLVVKMDATHVQTPGKITNCTSKSKQKVKGHVYKLLKMTVDDEYLYGIDSENLCCQVTGPPMPSHDKLGKLDNPSLAQVASNTHSTHTR
jgi:hypothetical protein